MPLTCPGCGGALDPLPEDVVFLCAACGGASELATDGPRTRSCLVLGPPHGTGEAGGARDAAGPIYLPFWRFAEASVTPAFNGSRLLTLTRWYSHRPDVLGPSESRRIPGLWGGSIGSGDARRVLALARENGAAAVKPSRPREEDDREGADDRSRERPGVLALPFRREESRLVCLLTGLHVYFETLESAREILERWAAEAP